MSPRAPRTPALPRRRLAAAILLAAALGASSVLASPAGVVVADDPAAAQVGAAVLRAGGNAADAAIATAFALAVTHPQAGNLGGGGFLLYRRPDGLAWVIDFRERAPFASSARMFRRSDGSPDARLAQEGPLSVGVPGSVAGLALAQRRFATLPLAALVAPAIRLARDGFPVPPGLAADLQEEWPRLGADPYTARLFGGGGRPLAAGERLVQTDLAATLERIARDGEAGFYAGETADLLLARLARWGARLGREDLAAYRAVERAPLRAAYRGSEVLTTPPPSAGGVSLLQMLRILEGFDPAETAPGSASDAHRMASAMQLAFADRARFLGDPDFADLPLARLLSPLHAARQRALIPAARALPAAAAGEAAALAPESSETTHLSVVDGEGGAAALTTTINSSFGAAVAVEGAGFLLNNEMDDFAAAPGTPNQFGLVQGEANAVAPGKRMASSMCPTIVLRDGRPVLVLGSPGGSRIPTALLQVIRNVLDRGMDLEAAVRAPRLHHQWLPDVLKVEEGALAPGAEQALRSMGYAIERIEAIGDVQAAALAPDGTPLGAADPRRYGAAAAAREPGAAAAR